MYYQGCPVRILHKDLCTYMSYGGLFSEAKKLYARNRHKDFVRRAAKFRVDSYSSFLVNLLEALRPPLLCVMQNIGHRTISPLKRDPRRTLDQYWMQNPNRTPLIHIFILLHNLRAYTFEHY